jgi:hypothetical protein
MMKYVKNLLTIFFVVSLVIGGFFFTSSVLKQETWAASVSWDGGAGTTNWSDATNWSGDLVPTAADDVLIDADVTVDLGSATTINSLVLGNSGGTTSPVLNFTYDASGTSSPLVVDDGSVTIYSGGKITHSAGTDVVVGTVGLDIQTGDLTVSSGGSVDADGKGYSGGYGNNPGNGPGAGLGAYNYAGGTRVGSGGGAYASTASYYSSYFSLC